jgi:hypothetical protein
MSNDKAFGKPLGLAYWGTPTGLYLISDANESGIEFDESWFAGCRQGLPLSPNEDTWIARRFLQSHGVSVWLLGLFRQAYEHNMQRPGGFAAVVAWTTCGPLKAEAVMDLIGDTAGRFFGRNLSKSGQFLEPRFTATWADVEKFRSASSEIREPLPVFVASSGIAVPEVWVDASRSTDSDLFQLLDKFFNGYLGDQPHTLIVTRSASLTEEARRINRYSIVDANWILQAKSETPRLSIPNQRRLSFPPSPSPPPAPKSALPPVARAAWASEPSPDLGTNDPSRNSTDRRPWNESFADSQPQPTRRIQSEPRRFGWRFIVWVIVGVIPGFLVGRASVTAGSDGESALLLKGNCVREDKLAELLSQALVKSAVTTINCIDLGSRKIGVVSDPPLPSPQPTASSGTVAPQKASPSIDQTVKIDAQKRLIELGYLKGTSDGKIGRQSTDAIERFQRDHSLPPTGLLDGDTLAALLRK